MDFAPAMVEIETPPTSFLRTDDYDPDKAACRLAFYWHHRKLVFGSRWLLPMTQTGRGALTSEDVAVIRKGLVLMVRSENREPVILCDYSRVAGVYETKDTAKLWDGLMDRLSMYWGTVLSDEAAQRGTKMVQILTSAKRRFLAPRPDCWKMIRTALPLKITKFIVAQAYEPYKECLFDFTRPALVRVGKLQWRKSPHVIRGDSVADTLHKLNQQGLSTSIIPQVLGGHCDYNQELHNWIGKRLEIESVAGTCRAAVPIELIAATRSNSRRLCAGSSTRKPLLSSPNQGTANDPQTMKRKRRAVYSRRCYHRRKLAIVSGQDQVRDLQATNDKLRAENHKLQMLLDQARFVMSLFPYFRAGYSNNTYSLPPAAADEGWGATSMK